MVDRYPLIVAANRDEHFDRPTAAPGLWSTEPKILAGKDLLAGGTWLGVNKHGLLVGILNRRSSGGPDPLNQTRSRGLLCLDLLSLKSAADAHAFVDRHQEPYQPFTVVFVDPSEAWIAYNVGRQIKTHKLNQGLHVYSNAAEFAVRTEKVDRAHVQFARVQEEARSNCSDKSLWVRSLRKVLGDHTLGNGSNDARDAICVHGDLAGTVSSTIIFLDQPEQRFYSFNCPGPPCRTSFTEALVLHIG
jgi:uncharacterized protein with NRDE domain